MPRLHALWTSIHQLLTAIALVTVATAASADLNGRWQTGPGQFTDIVQTGSDVSLTLEGYQFDGTFDGSSLAADYAGAAFLRMVLLDAGDALDGTTRVTTSVYHEFFRRCECDDGNAIEGDGCDAECQVEPCFTCSAPPSSVCSPSLDAAVCDDRNDCTTGETCSAGICGGGSAVTPCVNLTGLWREVFDQPQFGFHSVGQARYVQRDGFVVVSAVSASPGTVPNNVGTVDTATGAMELVARGGGGLCFSVSSTFSGNAALDNSIFTGGGFSYSSTPMHCFGWSYTRDGDRCDDGGCDDSCSVRPRSGCLASVEMKTSRLQIRDKPGSDKDQMRWLWKHGAETAIYFFGDPAATSSVSLCLFDESIPTPALMFEATVPAGGACLDPPCWTSDGETISYKDKSGTADGVSEISMRTGEEGKASISVRAKGAGLSSTSLPTAPLALPVRAQLQIDGGACFDTGFDVGGMKKNDEGFFKANGGAP